MLLVGPSCGGSRKKREDGLGDGLRGGAIKKDVIHSASKENPSPDDQEMFTLLEVHRCFNSLFLFIHNIYIYISVVS